MACAALDTQESLLSLPDEILVHIATFLNAIDKISISHTCQRWNNIMDEKRLIRNINLNAAYDLQGTALKYIIGSKLRCSCVTVLNITSCYWVIPSDIITCVVKLKQLISFYAADTQLTFAHLIRILPALSKLERLSISGNAASLEYRNGKKPAETLSKELGALKYLLVCLTVDKYWLALAHLTNWLKYCSRLEEFWLLSQIDAKQSTRRPSMWPVYNKDIHFSKLHTCVLEMPKLGTGTDNWMHFLDSLFRSCSETHWKSIWLHCMGMVPLRMPDLRHLYGCETLFASRVMPGEYPNLKHLFLEGGTTELLVNETIQLPRLENLCIADTGPHTQYAWLEKFTALHSLAFLEVKITDDTLFKAVGQLHNLCSLSFLDCEFLISMEGRAAAIKSFNALTISVRGLKEFELSAILEPNTKDWVFWDQLLPYISNWKQLTKLALDDLMIVEDKFLLFISTSCPDMESISISNLGAQSLCKHVSAVCKALPNWKKLKDFRFEQSNIALLRQLVVALQNCPSIERIAIIENGSSGVPLSPEIRTEVLSLLRTSTCLIFFYLRMALMPASWKNIMLAESKNIQQQGNLHQNFRIYLESLRSNNLPFIHRSMVHNRMPASLQKGPGTWYYPRVKFP